MRRPGDPTPLDVALADLPALLLCVRRDPGDPEEAVELVVARKHLARFADAPPDVVEQLDAAVEALTPALVEEGLSDAVAPALWSRDAARLAAARTAAGVAPGPFGAGRYEALRLFRLLDGWRLALLGARRLCGTGGGDLPERVEVLVRAVLEDPVVLAPAAPWAAAHIGAFAPDVATSDPELAALDDLYRVVAGMAC